VTDNSLSLSQSLSLSLSLYIYIYIHTHYLEELILTEVWTESYWLK
jgi:hypothetical protein